MGLYGNKDRELDTTVVNDLINAQFKDLAPIEVKYLKSGMDSDAFLINQHLIFRFPKRADVAKVLNREVVILPHLKDKFKIAIPEFEYFGIPSPLFPYHFVGYRQVPPPEGLTFTHNSVRV